MKFDSGAGPENMKINDVWRFRVVITYDISWNEKPKRSMYIDLPSTKKAANRVFFYLVHAFAVQKGFTNSELYQCCNARRGGPACIIQRYTYA